MPRKMAKAKAARNPITMPAMVPPGTVLGLILVEVVGVVEAVVAVVRSEPEPVRDADGAVDASVDAGLDSTVDAGFDAVASRL